MLKPDLKFIRDSFLHQSSRNTFLQQRDEFHRSDTSEVHTTITSSILQTK